MKPILSRLLIATMLFSICTLNVYALKYPKWLLGKSDDYPESSYVIGVGEGKTLISAQDAARAEISKLFEARVVQVSRDLQKEKTVTVKNKTKTENDIDVEVETKVFSDQILEGIQIKDTWFNSKINTYYVLAVLDKKKMSADLSSKMSEYEKTARLKLDEADKARTPVDKAVALSQVLKAYDKEKEIIKKKRIVDGMPNISFIPSRSEVEARRNEALKKIVFVVNEEGNNGIKEIVNENLTKMGLKVSSNGSGEPKSSAVYFKCKLSMKPIDRGNPEWKFVVWEGAVEMREGSVSGTLLESDGPSGQVSNTSEETAKEKALITAKKVIAFSVENMIKRYILGE